MPCRRPAPRARHASAVLPVPALFSSSSAQSVSPRAGSAAWPPRAAAVARRRVGPLSSPRSPARAKAEHAHCLLAAAAPLPVSAARPGTGVVTAAPGSREALSRAGSRLPPAPRPRRAPAARVRDATNRLVASRARDEAPARQQAPACRANRVGPCHILRVSLVVVPPYRNGCAGGEFPSFLQ